jgi:hypothetical protein
MLVSDSQPRSAGPLWQLALPHSFSKRADFADTVGFLHRLKLFAQNRGGTVIELPFSRLPWTRRGITLNFHSTGFMPNAYHYKESFLNGWIQIDRLGHSGWHSRNFFSPTAGRALACEEGRKKTLDQRLEQYVLSRKSKYLQRDQTDLPQENFVFLPLQKPQDDTSDFARFDLGDAILRILDWCRARGLKLVIKRHPFCYSNVRARMLDALKQHPEVILTEGNVGDLIDKAAVVVTVNSSVGFETLLRRRNIVSLGQSEYTPLSLSVSSLDKLPDVLDEALANRKLPDEKWAAVKDFVMDSLFENHDPLDIECFFEKAVQRYGDEFPEPCAPILPLPDFVSFSEDGEGKHYLLHGFSFPEIEGVWTNDELATLVFAANQGRAEYAVKLKGYVLESWPEIAFDVFANDSLVSAGQSVKLYKGDCEFRFAANWQQGVNTITFRIRNPVRPVDFDLDFDVRRIGLGLISLSRVSS